MDFRVGDRVRVIDNIPCQNCVDTPNKKLFDCSGLNGVITDIYGGKISVRWDNGRGNYTNCTYNKDYLLPEHYKELI
jgi:threonine dehydrogenase-like Zn-dependent dehydrogenase